MSNTVKILLVDDEPDILEFLSYNFRKKEFTVITANNGLEGLQKAEEELPALIISDILMPEMDGIKMCEQLKLSTKFTNVPILFLTAVVDDYKVLYAMTAGASQIVSKPIKFEYLLSIVNKALDDQRILMGDK